MVGPVGFWEGKRVPERKTGTRTQIKIFLYQIVRSYTQKNPHIEQKLTNLTGAHKKLETASTQMIERLIRVLKAGRNDPSHFKFAIVFQ